MPEMLYSFQPGLVLGFHGCEEEIRDAVIGGKLMLKSSVNPYDWLGHGIYFWQNNYQRAWEYAARPPGKPGFKRPAVLGAVLVLGNCLDLVETTCLERVSLAHRDWKRSKGRATPALMNKNVGNSGDLLLRYLDCSVLEHLHFVNGRFGHQPYDSVRGVFVEGNPVYEGAGIYDKTHVQICIRNPNCIQGFFVPRKRIHWP